MKLELEKRSEELNQEEVAVTKEDQVEESVCVQETEESVKEEVLEQTVTEEGQKQITIEKEETIVISQEQTSKSQLSILMGIEDSILEREYVEQNVKKFLAGIGRAVLRSDSLDGDMKRMFASAKDYYLGGILASPLYLNACAKLLKKKEKRNFEVGAIVDFPFGEGTFKSKLHDVKACGRAKVNFTVITFPTLLANKDNAKILRRQTKRLIGAFKKNRGIAINASGLPVEEISRIIKLFYKTKMKTLTLLFNDSMVDEIVEKVSYINKGLNGKKLYLLTNLQKAEEITKLRVIGVERVFTPHAEDIAKDVLERFGIKETKLY